MCTRRIPYLNGARFGLFSADSVDTNAIGRGMTVLLSIWVASLNPKVRLSPRSRDVLLTRLMSLPSPMSSIPAPHLLSTLAPVVFPIDHLRLSDFCLAALLI